MQPKRENSVHVRLTDEADAMLELLAESHQEDKAKIAANILQRALLGEGHALKVAAMRFASAGITGRVRE